MPYIHLCNGLKLFYRERGCGDSTVLFIHGNAASSLWWERVLDGLPHGIRAVAPDLRGCGDSDKPEEDWSLEELAGDFRLVIDQLKLGPCAVVGHSLGGAVALYLAVEYPELVSRLMLINSAPVEGLYTPEERLQALEEATRHPDQYRAILSAMMPTAPHDGFYERILAESYQKSAGALVRNGRALNRMDLRERAASIQVPTLILYGSQDPLVSLDMLERSRDAIPGATLEVWDDAGHSPPVEVPGRVRDRLLSFL